ncbi:MAG: hypothetical protein ABGX23_00890 [Nautiliaceae bacterium]
MFEEFCEYDINPFIIFNQKGEIKYCNQEAEILLSYINQKEIFQFAIKNAPKNPEIITEFKKIKFNDFEFTGYAIGYKDEKEIGVRFFIDTHLHSINLEDLEKSDILKLIHFAIEYTKLKHQTKFKIYPDPDLPEIFINKKAFINLLLDILEGQKKAEIETKIKIGEYIKIQNKKYSILSIIITTIPKKEIKSNFFEVINLNNGYIIQIPIIKEKDENSNT